MGGHMLLRFHVILFFPLGKNYTLLFTLLLPIKRMDGIKVWS